MTDSQSDQRAAEARLGEVCADGYRLRSVLGVGGMGAVYDAVLPGTEHAVAIKILHRRLARSVRCRARFLREANVSRAIAHTGVVRIHGEGACADGVPYFVMERLHGQTLSELAVRAGGRLSARMVLDLVRPILSTLHAAHQVCITHRDLKPANLLRTHAGNVMVLDFGIARASRSGHSSSDTQDGAALGTPGYMAPEQARGQWHIVDARSDLWAVGAVMFNLLSGELVHGAGGSAELIGRAATMSAPRIATRVAGLSPTLAQVIDRALSFEPGARWPNADAMGRALAQCPEFQDGAAKASGVYRPLNSVRRDLRSAELTR